VKHKVKRDPATYDIIAKVWADNSIDSIIKAACVITYTAGARGGNIFLTSYSRTRRHMLIKWSDVEPRNDENGQKYFLLRIRKEKTAKRHTDSFQPIALTKSQEPQPCAVTALAMAAKHKAHQPLHASAPIFGTVTDHMVSAALNKHATGGNRYTSHSLRQGLATDIASTSASDRTVQIAGRWNSAESAKPYIRLTPQLREELNKEIRARGQAQEVQAQVQSTSPAEPVGQHMPDASPEHPGTQAPGSDHPEPVYSPVLPVPPATSGAGTAAEQHEEVPALEPHMRMRIVSSRARPDPVVFLAAKVSSDMWHMYFYDARSQARALYTAQGPPALPHAHFERISADPYKEELEYFMASTKPIDIASDSQADRDVQRLLTQWRESPPPHTARLTERDEEEDDPDAIDHTPPYAPVDEIWGPPAGRTRTRMRGRFRPNPPPARPRYHPGYTVIRHDNE